MALSRSQKWRVPIWQSGARKRDVYGGVTFVTPHSLRLTCQGDVYGSVTLVYGSVTLGIPHSLRHTHHTQPVLSLSSCISVANCELAKETYKRDAKETCNIAYTLSRAFPFSFSFYLLSPFSLSLSLSHTHSPSLARSRARARALSLYLALARSLSLSRARSLSH